MTQTAHSGRILLNENGLCNQHHAHVHMPTGELVMASGKRVKLRKLPGDERFYLRMFFPRVLNATLTCLAVNLVIVSICDRRQ